MMNSNQFQIALEQSTQKQINNINTAIAGAILSYSGGRASVQPKGLLKYEDGRSLSYPVIYDVPVVFPVGSGGSCGVTFPIKAGDGCLLVFSQDNMQSFLTNSQTDDNRKFQLTDAICIPGLYNSNISNYNQNEVVVFNGGSKFTLGNGGLNGTLADGTTFSFSGGDLVVNGISLVNHVHSGVMSGGSNTGKPV